MTNHENAAEVVKIPVEDWLAVAKEHGVPCHLDAAADMPPISNLWTLAAKWDLVCFSGGKGIRGPQSAPGLLLGKKKYTDLANNMLPPVEGVARGMKVAKEQIVGMVAAVDWILSQTEEDLFKESNDRLAVMASILKDVPSVKTRVIVHCGRQPLPATSRGVRPQGDRSNPERDQGAPRHRKSGNRDQSAHGRHAGLAGRGPAAECARRHRNVAVPRPGQDRRRTDPQDAQGSQVEWAPTIRRSDRTEANVMSQAQTPMRSSHELRYCGYTEVSS